MTENPTPSWEGESVILSELCKPENRGPGYDTQMAKDLRAGKKVTRVTINPSYPPRIINIIVDNDK